MAKKTDCLTTTVKNNTGVSKVFSFLPPHGRRLAAGQWLTFTGHLTDIVANGDAIAGKRKLAALTAAIAAGQLLVLDTPNPVLYDGFTDDSYMIQVKGRVLTITNPSFDSVQVGADHP